MTVRRGKPHLLFDGDAAGIALRNTRKIVWIDSDDLPLLGDCSVSLANGQIRLMQNRQCGVSVARFLLGLKGDEGVIVNHLDGDPLNLRRSNLKIVKRNHHLPTEAERRNARIWSLDERLQGMRAEQGLIGFFKNDSGNFTARFRDMSGKRHTIGTYNTEIEAARAFDAARVATGLPPINFPDDVWALADIPQSNVRLTEVEEAFRRFESLPGDTEDFPIRDIGTIFGYTESGVRSVLLRHNVQMQRLPKVNRVGLTRSQMSALLSERLTLALNTATPAPQFFAPQESARG
jgi:hypothetical protein